ncbi:MAG TPA: phosphotransferase [Rhizomicrobium sp.]|nr:phosphotransferase [Rhizomicrobium sp.]
MTKKVKRTGEANEGLTWQKLPDRLEEITPDFLTAVLSVRWPDIAVRSVRVAAVSQGSATRAQLELEYDKGGDAPPPASMWVKSSFNELRKLISEWEALEAEARFYHAPVAKARRPECYFAAFDRTGQSLLLLEDLVKQGATFGHVTKPCTVEQAAAILTELARLHAEFWRSPRRSTDMSWFQTTTTGALSEFYNGNLIDLMPKLLERGRRRLWVPERLRQDNALGLAFRRLQQRNNVDDATFLHFDCHVGNTFFQADGRGGLLDFQSVRWGRWAHDVGYFLGGAVSVEDRRAWERDLIEHYLAQLRANGVNAPSSEQARAAYAEQPIYGLLIWLTTMPEMQHEEVCEEYCERYAAAALDLGSLAALGM